MSVKKKAIIFGINGQDGHYLEQLLTKEAIQVLGVSRSKNTWLQGDISDLPYVENLIREHRPDYIFHLAANSTTSHNAVFENHATIVSGTLNILESVYKFSQNTKVFLSGSALQFVNHGLPISENDPFDTTSAYSVSRIQSVYTARYYRSKGLMVYIGYFFHHDSPFRSERHLNMKIVKTALKIERGQEEILEIGNLDVVKEFNYAGDIMEAVWLLVNQSNVLEAVLGSGTGYPIKAWIEICFDMIGKDWTKHTKINTDFKAEFSSLVSDPKTLYQLGWQPLINIDKLAFKMMKESSNV